MNLRRFSLGLPYLEDESVIADIMKEQNCSYNEATRMDFNATWREKGHVFLKETRCVSALFERFFGKMKTEASWKVLVECVEHIWDNRILNIGGVKSVQIEFDYDYFNQSSDYEKKRQTLELLMRGIRIVAPHEGWDIAQFESAYDGVIAADYNNEYVWKKPVRNADKTLMAEVFCRHGVQSLDAFIVIRDKKKNEIMRKQILSAFPDELVFSNSFGELKWLSDHEVALVNRVGTKQLRFDMNRDKCIPDIIRKKRD